MLQRHVGVRLLQPIVLGLQVLQALQVRCLEAAILRLPLIETGRADAVLPTKILNLTAIHRLLEDLDDLAVAETGLHRCHLLHHTYSMMADVSIYDLSTRMGSLRDHCVSDSRAGEGACPRTQAAE